MSFISMLNRKCDILAPTKTRNSDGSWAEAEIVIHKNLKCRLRVLSGEESKAYTREAVQVTHRLYCTYHADINEDCRVLFAGKYYIVEVVNHWDHDKKHLQVELRQVR